MCCARSFACNLISQFVLDLFKVPFATSALKQQFGCCDLQRNLQPLNLVEVLK